MSKADDYVFVSMGSIPLAYCHFSCLGVTLGGLEHDIDTDREAFTVWSLKRKDEIGNKIDYSEIECYVVHEKEK